MTTTSQFQQLPDFYDSKPEPLPTPKNTNSRYSSFTQTHFTAGDIEQFETYRDPTNGEQPNRQIDLDHTNVWKDFKIEDFYKKYLNLTTQSVMNTFLYLFEKFKKGVFVKIKDNKLDVFLPFSKINYENEWGNRMQHPQQFENMTSFLQYASKLQGYDVKSNHINSYANKWYANNCLIRTEFPIGENDRCVANLKDMLETLCNERTVPDIELFFNRRDFPLLKKNNTEPYEHIYDDENFPLQSHRYDKYCPILSMVTTDINADIAFPTMEDWARISSQEDNKLFSPDFKNYNHNFVTKWDSKKSTAVFRGASTGCGVTVHTNPRLKLAKMSITSPIEDGFPLLDAGITKWNCRPRKLYKNPILQVINPEILKKDHGIRLVNSLTPVEQSSFKYIVNVDGHVSAFRLSLELSMGSVVLLQKSKYRVWFRSYLVEYEHYVPIEEDLSDLYEKIRWCKEHDKECKTIAQNARQFYDTYLSKKGTLDFVQKLFCEIKEKTGTYFYNYKSIKHILYEKQLEHLSIKNDKDSKLINPVYSKLINPGILPTLSVNDAYKLRLGLMNGFRLFLKEHQLQLPDFEKNLVKKHQSKDSLIGFLSIKELELQLSVKKSKRTYGLVNEAFTGLYCINSLLQEIPNFKYTFGIEENKDETYQYKLYTEYIDGMTFSEFIKICNINDFIGVLQQLFLALAVAQERFGFVHHDLSPWNIIIKKLQTPQTIVYSYKDQVVVVETRIIPIIIDYDRSHFIYKNMHYGIISPFMTSTVQDCFSIIVHSCYEFLSRRLASFEMKTILYIVNFLSNTKFHPYTITRIEKAKEFLSSVKKYNEMVYRNKCDLEKLQPEDFFSYLEDQYVNSTMINIKSIDGKKVYKECNYINPLFFYDMMIGKSFNENLLSYLDEIEDQVKNKLEHYSEQIVYYVYSMNKIYHYSRNVLLFINYYKTQDYFIQERNCNRLLSTISTKMEYKIIERETPICGHFIETKIVDRGEIYCSTCKQNMPKKEQPITLSIGNMLEANTYLILGKYTPETFSVRGTILTILQENNKLLNQKYIGVWYMLRELILYQYAFSIPNESTFQKTYGKLLSKISPLAILNHNANYQTIRKISKEMYEIDKEKLENLNNKPKKTLQVIDHILALLE